MNIEPARTTTTVIPGMLYRDAPAAIEWLCRAFGFTKQVVFTLDDGRVAHAQLTFGNGMVMLGSGVGGELDPHTAHPDDTGGRETRSLYLVVADADAVYERATAAGAEVVVAIRERDFGGRDFTCRDPEGHLWTFGTFDPWSAPA